MYLSKYKGKTFPAGKSAKELGIDTSRKFVVVNGLYKGNVVTMVEDDNTTSPLFENSMGHYLSLYLSDLAYLEEEDEIFFAEGVSNIEVYDTPKDMLNAFGQKVLSDPTVTEVTIAVGKQIDEPYAPRAEDRVRLEEDEKADYPKNMQNYYDNKVAEYLADTPKPYVPRAGDKVRLEGEIVIDEHGPWIKCPLRNNGGYNSWLITDIPASLTLISRPPRTLTKAEAEKMLSERLGEEITIE